MRQIFVPVRVECDKCGVTWEGERWVSLVPSKGRSKATPVVSQIHFDIPDFPVVKVNNTGLTCLASVLQDYCQKCYEDNIQTVWLAR